jgi:D-glycero-D-manno-heptose 1,7-bisphosphate phosphatase
MADQKRAVFLDRDGTINVDYGYVGKVEQFAILPRVKDALKLLQDNGFLLFIISNQSGVNRGYYTKDDLRAVHDKMVAEFGEDGILFSEAFYCLHRPDERCDCRKPSPKAVKDIARKFNIDLARSYFIGDKETDVLTGRNAGTRTVLVSGGAGTSGCDYAAGDLFEAASWIVKERSL